MSVLLSVLVGVLAAYLLIYYSLFKGARFKSNVTLKGKTAIVTGSNTGIGKTTALDLAKRGARVILACRNKEKAEAAVYDIRKESGNPEVLYMHLDLASLKSVRGFAETFLKSEPRLDLLINNAGLIVSGRTEDGFGMAFGVNHLGHFLLTLLLLDRLKQAEHSRVVNVSALLHRLGSVDFNLLNTHKDLVTGVIATEIGRNMGVLQKLLFLPMSKLFFLDPEGGAQSTLYCALQEGLEPLSGRYFSSCALQNVSAQGKDDALARKLWEVSERLCGL
ncbi:dehydrogenase/reductase SDR family member 13a.3 isoform X2 [Carassius carassius]|uniref:dehydrogenase/reductase SDR family member 13a.3 isoform X2 n=1 Tax=Carassius carassius TaxID=217509 RepID=UPI0028694A18|nr:dehydrogenase/reductase SDR family member 13a.3 isoform X2 [Carassius carassius]